MLPRRTVVIAPLFALLALDGCAYGPVYWTRYDATPDLFLADHRQCVDVAAIAGAFGAAAAYKSCMGEKGWVRVQARGSQPVPEPHFLGPEVDEDFTTASNTTPQDVEQQCQRWRNGLDRPPSLSSRDCP
jgi:hypothetical protein